MLHSTIQEVVPRNFELAENLLEIGKDVLNNLRFTGDLEVVHVLGK